MVSVRETVMADWQAWRASGCWRCGTPPAAFCSTYAEQNRLGVRSRRMTRAAMIRTRRLP